MGRGRDRLSRYWKRMPKCTPRRRWWSLSSSRRQMSEGTTANPISNLPSIVCQTPLQSCLPASPCHRLDPCQRFSRSRSACWKLCHATEVRVLAIEALKSAGGRTGRQAGVIYMQRSTGSPSLQHESESSDRFEVLRRPLFKFPYADHVIPCLVDCRSRPQFGRWPGHNARRFTSLHLGEVEPFIMRSQELFWHLLRRI